MTDRYILDANGTPVVEPDLLKWAQWFETADRTVAHDELPNGVKVSTIFLGIDHGFDFFGQKHTPVLWETMIFRPKTDEDRAKEAELALTHPDLAEHMARMTHTGDECWRYTSREDAIDGHAHALRVASANIRRVVNGGRHDD